MSAKFVQLGKYLAFGLTLLLCVLVVCGVSACMLNQSAERDFNTLYAKANDCFDRHDYQQAAANYNSALSRIGSSDKHNLRALALIALSKTYLELNQAEEAAKACSQALLLLRRSYKTQGADYEKRDGLEAAKASLLLGQIYYEQEKYKEAEAAYVYALRVEEDCVGPLYLKDDIIQNYAELLKHLHRDTDAARLKGTDNDSYFSVYLQRDVADRLIHAGKLKEAETMLTETAKFTVDNNLVDKDSVSCLAQLADLSFKLKEYDKAAQAADQLIEMLKQSDRKFPLIALRAYTIGGQVALQKGELEKADNYFSEALKICNESAEAKVASTRKEFVLKQLAELKAKQRGYKRPR